MKAYIKYFLEEDVLFIPLNNKKSPIGDEDYQDNVVLYKDIKNPSEINSIEILNFSNFEGNIIQIDKDKAIDFSEQFRPVRMFISLKDIMYNDPTQFEETLKIWGFKKVKEETPSKSFSVPTRIPIGAYKINEVGA